MGRPTKEEITDLFTRGVHEFFDPDGKFKKKLEENPKSIVIKLGVDPTRPDINIGHAVILRKLRKFQDLGCKVVFLIGDYTAQIGDPTGKNKTRPDLEQGEVEANAKTYIDQVGKILNVDSKVFSWIRNSDWYYSSTDLVPDPNIKSIDIDVKKSNGESTKVALKPDSFLGKAIFYENTRMQKTHLHNPNLVSITLRGLLWTLKNVTHSRLINRDMFQIRIKNGEELYMHEMMYPILQGIDSFAIANVYGSCDLEVGGTDQTFNMLMGRDVMKVNGKEPQAVLSFDLLIGLDGKEKMSKSLDNYIGITDEPANMFGKVMSIPDSLISSYFELCTYTPLEDIEEIKKDLEKGKKNPKDIKMRLAREITEIYHGREKAKIAEEEFTSVFSKKNIPSDINAIVAKKGTLLQDVLKTNSIVSSNSEFKRLISGKAIENISTKTLIDDPNYKIEEDITVRVGKNRFVKITLK